MAGLDSHNGKELERIQMMMIANLGINFGQIICLLHSRRPPDRQSNSLFGSLTREQLTPEQCRIHQIKLNKKSIEQIPI